MKKEVQTLWKKDFWNINIAWVKVLNRLTIIQHSSQTMSYKTLKGNCNCSEKWKRTLKTKDPTLMQSIKWSSYLYSEGDNLYYIFSLVTGHCQNAIISLQNFQPLPSPFERYLYHLHFSKWLPRQFQPLTNS